MAWLPAIPIQALQRAQQKARLRAAMAVAAGLARVSRAVTGPLVENGEPGGSPKCWGCAGLNGTPADCPHVRNLLRHAAAQREAEERIREFNGRFSRCTAELNDAHADLEAFRYAVSHELRAPVRQVASFAELLVGSSPGRLDAESAEYLPFIGKAAKRMGQLIDDLVAYSRLGRAEMRRAQVDIYPLVHEVRETLEPSSSDRAVSWRISALPTVLGDASMLRQVLVCLIENALKFTRPRPRAEIEIGCSSTSDEHTLHVRDNGVGFDARYADKLFGLFQRLHHAGEFEGAGIGLARVRRIVQRHGGRAWAESNIGEGATVYFSIPMDR